MKDRAGNTISVGQTLRLYDSTKQSEDQDSIGIFDVKRSKSGNLYFESPKYIVLASDIESFSVVCLVVEECADCGEYFSLDDLGLCKLCGEYVCQNCQQPCKGPPHPMVDYCVHKSCYEGHYERY